MKQRIDGFDVMVGVGFIALVAGLWLLSPTAALIAGGSLLIAGGLAGASLKVPRGGK